MIDVFYIWFNPTGTRLTGAKFCWIYVQTLWLMERVMKLRGGDRTRRRLGRLGSNGRGRGEGDLNDRR